VDEKNFYSILQVDPTATLDEVRAAYRRLAFLYHPDQSKDPDATRKMQALNAAFDVLGNMEKRLEYDRQRLSPPVTPAPPSPARPGNGAQPRPEAQPGNGAPPRAEPQTEARPGNGAKPQAEPPPAPPAKPAPPPVDPVILEKRRRRRQKRLRSQLKVIAFFTAMTFVLFGFSLINGRITGAVIVMLVVMIAYILGVFIMRIRSLRA
jgi:curved DNA-binding protein CbpA